MAEVHFDRSACDEHSFRDLRVGEPGRCKSDDAELGGGQAFPSRRRALAFAACSGDVFDHLAERKLRGFGPMLFKALVAEEVSRLLEARRALRLVERSARQ